jgi:hypothetical protein
MALGCPQLRYYLAPIHFAAQNSTRQQNVQQVRIISRHGFYVVEIIYEREPVQAVVDPALHAGVDSGIDNLATLASDKPGFIPRIVNGRPVKAINQYYNKRCAVLQSRLGRKGTSGGGRRTHGEDAHVEDAWVAGATRATRTIQRIPNLRSRSRGYVTTTKG